MDIYQDMADDPATLTSQLFSMPCRFDFFFFLTWKFLISSIFLIQFYGKQCPTGWHDWCTYPVTADDYQVLSTDYTNYAIEYRCEDRGLFQRRGNSTTNRIYLTKTLLHFLLVYTRRRIPVATL